MRALIPSEFIFEVLELLLQFRGTPFRLFTYQRIQVSRFDVEITRHQDQTPPVLPLCPRSLVTVLDQFTLNDIEHKTLRESCVLGDLLQWNGCRTGTPLDV